MSVFSVSLHTAQDETQYRKRLHISAITVTTEDEAFWN